MLNGADQTGGGRDKWSFSGNRRRHRSQIEIRVNVDSERLWRCECANVSVKLDVTRWREQRALRIAGSKGAQPTNETPQLAATT